MTHPCAIIAHASHRAAVTDRRRFLKFTGAALAAGAITPRILRALEVHAESDRIERLGIQLYTVRGEMEKNVERTLTRIAQIGYREVEFAGYFGRSPQQIRAALDAAGLEAPSAHIGIEDVRSPSWPATLEAARVMGHRYLIVAWLEKSDRVSQDSYKAIADSLVAGSALAAESGITLGYHNHNFEFTPLDGKTGLQLLLERTAHTSIVFELDLYWMTSAGQDPLAWFDAWPGRFPLVHVKDSGPPPKYEMHDVGAGTIDWKRIFRKSREAGIKHYFVEHDEPGDAFASAAASYSYLSRLTW